MAALGLVLGSILVVNVLNQDLVAGYIALAVLHAGPGVMTPERGS